VAKYFVFDLETTIKNSGESAIGKNKGTSHCPENYPVWLGYKTRSLESPQAVKLLTSASGKNQMTKWDTSGTHARENPVYVGQNIKFDILYLLRFSVQFRENIWPQLSIWDTALVEHILSGQTHMYPKLDKLALKYGGTVKDNRLKELWDAGVDTDMIADSIIEPYVKNDVANTELVFREQLKQISYSNNLMPLISTQMKALKATIEMEYNGMYFNKSAAKLEAIRMESDLASLFNRLMKLMSPAFPESYYPIPTSTKDVSIFLFGGDVQCVVKVPMLDDDGNPVLFKSGAKKGTPRTVNKNEVHYCEPRYTPESEWKNKTGWCVDDSVLKSILSKTPDNFCELLIEYREKYKIQRTYLLGYSDLTWPHDQCIHPNLNHVGTPTGRLTCTNPNLQNVKRNTDE
jgi:DNA polymerase I-like protein with 3'-5' exonuclease and polymerase domains